MDVSGVLVIPQHYLHQIFFTGPMVAREKHAVYGKEVYGVKPSSPSPRSPWQT